MDILTVDTLLQHYNPVAPTEFELVVIHQQTGTPGTVEFVLSGAVVGEPPELVGYLVVEIYNTNASVMTSASRVKSSLEDLLVKHFGYPAGWTLPE